MQKVTKIIFFIFTSRKKRYIRGDTEIGHKQSGCGPSRIIKEVSDIFGECLLSSFNDAIDQSYFPTALKQANIIPAFKTRERNSKDNYRPISILSNVSKNFLKIYVSSNVSISR